jgi:hypothetical protein
MSILIKDWNKFEWSNPAHLNELTKNLGRYLAGPSTEEYRRVVAKMQEFATPQDFPTSILEVLAKFHQTTPYDMGWQQIYKVLDLTGSKRNGFDITDVTSGLTFDKIPIGGKLEVKKMWGDKAHVYFDNYGGALGWHQNLFDDEEYWTLEDTAIAFRNAAYYEQAAVFYALIEAVAATGAVAWQAPSPAALAATDATYNANRDIRTMNAAAQQIVLAVASKGYGVTPQNAQFIVLTPLQLQERVKNALALNFQAFAGSPSQANYGFRPLIATPGMLADTAHAWVILPGNKLMAGIRMDLKYYSSYDMLSNTNAQAGWMRYGGAIGDTDQVVRIAFA